MELWRVYDEFGNPTEEIVEKSQKIENGKYHLGANVWIINSKNQILLQKRAETKKFAPNVWAMTGGDCFFNENSKQTIVRESKEELGIDVNENNLKLIIKVKTSDTTWVDMYILRADYDLSKMVLKKDEASDVKWFSIEEIETLIKENLFIENRWIYMKEIIKNEISKS